MDQAKLIALDWGTSSLRAYLLGNEGRILDKRESGHGILNVPGGDFLAAYLDICGQWLDRDNIPAIASGMIGSRQGWKEAPYAESPATLDSISRKLIKIDLPNSRGFYIIPGVSCINDEGNPEVMRGEETQILGAVAMQAIFVLPGTHSKWVTVDSGRIGKFSTFMTGELFAVLKTHSILGRLMTDSDGSGIDEAFHRGVRAAQLSKAGNLLNQLFSVRTLALFNQMEQASLPSYLSGMLIGEEIREALAMGFSPHSSLQPIMIMGDTLLVTRYRTAFDIFKLKTEILSPDAVVRGLWKIAVSAKIVELH